MLALSAHPRREQRVALVEDFGALRFAFNDAHVIPHFDSLIC